MTKTATGVGEGGGGCVHWSITYKKMGFFGRLLIFSQDLGRTFSNLLNDKYVKYMNN